MRKLGQLLGAVDAVARWSAGIALLFIVLILFVNSMARYFIGIAVVGGEELARYLMVWLTFLGSYLLVRVQRHVTVDVLTHLMPPKMLCAVDIVISTVGALVLGYVAWIGWELASFIMDTGQVMSSLPIRRGWIYMAVPVGCGLMAVAYGFQLLARLTGGEIPRPEQYGLPADPVAEQPSASPLPAYPERQGA